jgi:hypothetical protein
VQASNILFQLDLFDLKGFESTEIGKGKEYGTWHLKFYGNKKTYSKK